MALATVFRRNDDGEGGWRLSLTGRILAVNIFALIVLAGGFFYLDSYRVQLLEERTGEISTEAQLAATAAAAAPPERLNAMLEKLGEASGYRFRLYQGGGAPVDSWTNAKPSYVLRDPNEEPWRRHVARFMDRVIDHVVGGHLGKVALLALQLQERSPMLDVEIGDRRAVHHIFDFAGVRLNSRKRNGHRRHCGEQCDI